MVQRILANLGSAGAEAVEQVELALLAHGDALGPPICRSKGELSIRTPVGKRTGFDLEGRMQHMRPLSFPLDPSAVRLGVAGVCICVLYPPVARLTLTGGQSAERALEGVAKAVDAIILVAK